MNIFKKISLFFLLLLSSTFTMSIHAMEEEKENVKSSITARSGKELSELVKANKGYLVTKVKVPRGKPTETDTPFNIADIKACSSLKELSIGNTCRLYSETDQKRAVFEDEERINTEVIKELARSVSPTLTTLEINQTPSLLSGGANNENLQIFGNRAPGITHVAVGARGPATIGTHGPTKEIEITDEAFVHFPNLKLLVLVDAKNVKGDKLKDVDITRITHEDPRVLHNFRVIHITNPGFDKDTKISLPKGWILTDAEPGRSGNPSDLRKKPIGIEILGDNYTFSSELPTLKNFDKKTFLFTVKLRGTKPGATIQYWDGKNSITSAPYGSKTGEWETLSLEFTVDKQRAQFHRLYAAILGSQKNSDIEVPSVEVQNVRLQQK